MNKQILALTMSPLQSQWEVDRFEEEATKMGIPIKRAYYRNVQFLISNDQKIRIGVDGEEITAENTMGCIFRVAGTKSGKYIEGRNMLIRALKDKMVCVNAESYLNWPRMGKIAQHSVFVGNGIPVVPTKIFYTKEQIVDARTQIFSCSLPSGSSAEADSRSLCAKKLDTSLLFSYPLIVKHERGYQGKSVRKFETEKEMKKWLKKMDEKNLGMYLWQEFIPGGWDIRVIVIGGKAIGAMKRTAKSGEFRSNFSLGGEVEKWELADTDRELAEKVAKVCGLDYCGVDIMYCPNNPRHHFSSDCESAGQAQRRVEKDDFGLQDNISRIILEVNRQCQFKGFEKATGINVAKRLIEWMRNSG